MKDDIFELTANASFDELTPDLKKQVLAVMTEMEYRYAQAAIRTAPLLDAEVAPPPGLRAALLAQMGTVTPEIPSRRTIPWYQKAVPFWQAAAAVVVLAGAVTVWPQAPTPAPEVRTQTIVHTDTVYQERIVWKERVVTRKVVVREAVASPVHQDPAVPVSVGRSIAAQPELLQFFTRAAEK